MDKEWRWKRQDMVLQVGMLLKASTPHQPSLTAKWLYPLIEQNYHLKQLALTIFVTHWVLGITCGPVHVCVKRKDKKATISNYSHVHYSHSWFVLSQWAVRHVSQGYSNIITKAVVILLVSQNKISHKRAATKLGSQRLFPTQWHSWSLKSCTGLQLNCGPSRELSINVSVQVVFSVKLQLLIHFYM